MISLCQLPSHQAVLVLETVGHITIDLFLIVDAIINDTNIVIPGISLTH